MILLSLLFSRLSVHCKEKILWNQSVPTDEEISEYETALSIPKLLSIQIGIVFPILQDILLL